MEITRQIHKVLTEAGVRFLKKSPIYQYWYEADSKVERDKIGHCIRLNLQSENNSKIDNPIATGPIENFHVRGDQGLVPQQPDAAQNTMLAMSTTSVVHHSDTLYEPQFDLNTGGSMDLITLPPNSRRCDAVPIAGHQHGFLDHETVVAASSRTKRRANLHQHPGQAVLDLCFPIANQKQLQNPQGSKKRRRKPIENDDDSKCLFLPPS
jgi:hypothetical protein